MTNDHKQKCRRICEHYGVESQKGILTEECAELIQAVSKLTRAEQSGKVFDKTQAMLDMVEEMADVTIMIEQILHAYWNNAGDAKLDYYIEQKLTRQIGRIENE